MGLPNDCSKCHRRDPFSLAFGVEAVVPVETEVPTYRVDTFDEKENDEAMHLELDLID